MDEHNRKVLEMLAQGKITVEDAERLLEKLKTSNAAVSDESPPATEQGGAAARTQTPPTAGERIPPKNPKYLRVVVHAKNGDNVNIRVPMALLRTGIKLSTLMPEHARAKLEEQGVKMPDMSGMDANEFTKAMAELEVDVNDSDGDTVRIYCE